MQSLPNEKWANMVEDCVLRLNVTTPCLWSSDPDRGQELVDQLLTCSTALQSKGVLVFDRNYGGNA
jgi:hypothetical protein